jgi:hypothetical protein
MVLILAATAVPSVCWLLAYRAYLRAHVAVVHLLVESGDASTSPPGAGTWRAAAPAPPGRWRGRVTTGRGASRRCS